MSMNNRDCDPWRKEHVSRTARLQPRRAGKSLLPQDKVTTKDSSEIIMPQTKGAFHKEEIGGIMDLLGKEIIGETTGIILPPILETMSKGRILPRFVQRESPVLNYQGPQPQYSQQGCMQGGGSNYGSQQNGPPQQNHGPPGLGGTMPMNNRDYVPWRKEHISRTDKAITKGSREIIITQTKGALQKEIGGIMDLLGKEITGETTGTILPPMVETMGKVKILAMDNITRVKGQRSAAQMEQMGMQGEQGELCTIGTTRVVKPCKAQPPIK
ncbi:hypothetical protein OIU79_007730 [Salix purpurea]|uniref:Uncharacterized protein n=1 Tax=Salix purpurea TaxID=77065 RepID=A0A9Q0TGP7_SALPP|nr:hypothetical protein OIU79_007730 [Salix purpurea]